MARAETGLFYDAEAREMARRDKEMIPRQLVFAMFALASTALALTSYAVLTDRPHVGQPKPAAVMAERQIVLTGEAQGATVTTPEGAVLMATDEGGFVAAIRQGLDRERLVHRVEGNPPVLLTERESGRLTIADPATGWQVELGVFGADNRAAWLPLLENAGI
jgi:putative photosynthetic complex assembly protein